MSRMKSVMLGLIVVLLSGCGVADTRAQATSPPATAQATSPPATPSPIPPDLGALPLEELLFQPGDMPPGVKVIESREGGSFYWVFERMPPPARFLGQIYGWSEDKTGYASSTDLYVYPSAGQAAAAYATLLRLLSDETPSEIIPLDGMAGSASLILPADSMSMPHLILTACRAVADISADHDVADRERMVYYARRLAERINAIDCAARPSLPAQDATFTLPPAIRADTTPTPPAAVQPPVQEAAYQRPFIRALSFVDAAHGWIVSGRDLLATADGGRSWALQYSGDISLLAFADQLHGWMLADATLFFTTDGGASWAARSTPAPINKLSLIDQTSAAALTNSGLYRLTMDSDTPDLLTEETFRDVRFWDAASGWGYSKRAASLGLVQTSDGGRTWTPLPLPECSVGEPATAAMLALGQAYVLCDQWVEGGVHFTSKQLRRTDDAGASWRLVADETVMPRPVGSQLTFWDDLHGRMGSYVTADGGQTWTYAHPASDPEDHHDGGRPLSPDVAFFIIDPYAARGYQHLYRTTDGGQTWEVIYHVPHDPPYASDGVTLWPDGTGLALRGVDQTGYVTDTLLRTEDNGRSWDLTSPLALPCPHSPAARIDPAYNPLPPAPSIIWLTPQQGWALDTCTGAGPMLLFQTSDGGASWAHMDAAGLDQPLIGLSFATPTSGYGVALDGSLWRTDDAGASFWLVDATGRHGPAIHFASPEVGWNIYDGRLLRTGDGGRTWSRIATPERALDVGVQDERRLWVITAVQDTYDVTTRLLVSGDGGASWTAQDFGEDLLYRSIRFSDSDHGWLWVDREFYRGDMLFVTSDGGQTWAHTQ